MRIKDGGSVSKIKLPIITEIKITAINGYLFELWINESLSYMTLEEALKLRDELQNQIHKSISQGGLK